MSLKQFILESIEEEVLKYLKNIIAGTEWDNQIYLVGGAVRDEIMGKSSKDLDFLVLGDINAGIEFSTWLAQKLGNHKENSNPVIYPRFGTAKLSLTNNNSNLPNIDLEFVAPRKETYESGSRKPEVTSGDLKSETYRRDLTINSLMKNISTGEILDLSGKGISDIKNKIIRTTADPDIIFKEDPLRLIRSVRFSIKYNFKIDPNTLNGIKKNAHHIESISKERITDELNKILLSSNPSEGIKLLKETGLLQYILPEFNGLIGLEQNKYHSEDAFNHTMSVLANTPPDLKTRLMALFHDVGKVLTKTVSPDGSIHFYGHEKMSEEMVKDIMKKLKYPNELIDAVATGVSSHMLLKHGEGDASKLSDKSLRKFATAVGENLENILDLIHADNISHSDESSMPDQINRIRERLKTLEGQLNKSDIKLPLTGNDLIKMGFTEGPLIGKIKGAIQDAWYENPNLTKEEAIQIANSFKLEQNINEIKILMNKII
jgi:tRNA nucleotidyltransferase/poly(A) polymerase